MLFSTYTCNEQQIDFGKEGQQLIAVWQEWQPVLRMTVFRKFEVRCYE